MIPVDSFLWIAHLRGRRTSAAAKQDAAAGREPLLIGDLILLEVLQGARDDAHAARIAHGLRHYAVVAMLDDKLAARASRNYRTLRERGVTIGKTADVITGMVCNEHHHALLHDERDVVPMEKHLGPLAV